MKNTKKKNNMRSAFKKNALRKIAKTKWTATTLRKELKSWINVPSVEWGTAASNEKQSTNKQQSDDSTRW